MLQIIRRAYDTHRLRLHSIIFFRFIFAFNVMYAIHILTPEVKHLKSIKIRRKRFLLHH